MTPNQFPRRMSALVAAVAVIALSGCARVTTGSVANQIIAWERARAQMLLAQKAQSAGVLVSAGAR